MLHFLMTHRDKSFSILFFLYSHSFDGQYRIEDTRFTQIIGWSFWFIFFFRKLFAFKENLYDITSCRQYSEAEASRSESMGTSTALHGNSLQMLRFKTKGLANYCWINYSFLILVLSISYIVWFSTLHCQSYFILFSVFFFLFSFLILINKESRFMTQQEKAMLV